MIPLSVGATTSSSAPWEVRPWSAPPHRIVDWTQLQAFVPRLTYSTRPWESAQKIAAETAGSGVHQMGFRSAHRSSGARRK
jgi:hypothetical protein